METNYKTIRASNLFKQLKTETNIRKALQSKMQYLKLYANLQSLPAINERRTNKPVLWAGIINEQLVRNSNNLSSYKKALTHKRIQEVINRITKVINGRIVYSYPKHPKGKSFNLGQFRQVISKFPNLQRALNKKLSARTRPKTLYVTNLPTNQVTLNNLRHGEEVYRDPTGYFYFKPNTIQNLLKYSNTGKIRIPQTRAEVPLNKFLKGSLYNLRLATAALARSRSRSRSFGPGRRTRN